MSDLNNDIAEDPTAALASEAFNIVRSIEQRQAAARKPWGWALIQSPLTATVCIGEQCPSNLRGLPNVQAVYVDHPGSESRMKHLTEAEHEALVRDAAEGRRLTALINTPELLDFAKAVHLEACHQEVRWGAEDRELKTPAEWFWLLSHLATRALEHHKEAERLRAGCAADEPNAGHAKTIAHHREKAVHHTITAAAVLAHWHASVLGGHLLMHPGVSAATAQLAAELVDPLVHGEGQHRG